MKNNWEGLIFIFVTEKSLLHTSCFQNTVNLVPGFLKAKLDSEMDEVATSGWQKVIDAMLAVIGEKLKNIEEGEGGTSID